MPPFARRTDRPSRAGRVDSPSRPARKRANRVQAVQPLPARLWVVRHGQSAGNVARDTAELAGHLRIDVASRDMDVPLSALGERQAQALGQWFAARPVEGRPTIVLASPYARAVETARIVVDEAFPAAGAPPLRCDERLREKEFGILDRMTTKGIAQAHPGLYEQRAHVGKFYFRPPGGESWCDVILRLRGVLETMSREHAGERVLIVAHQVIVNCLRYLLERLSESEILAIDRMADVPNCGVTEYRFDPARDRHGALRLVSANIVAPLREAGAPVTAAPDVPVAVKP